jgi:hypothetical protein
METISSHEVTQPDTEKKKRFDYQLFTSIAVGFAVLALLSKDNWYILSRIPYLIFVTPQVLRRQFERFIDPMVMREYRIFAGPPALVIQLPSCNGIFLGVKLVFSIGGLLFVPSKGTTTYMKNKKCHGLWMISLFLVNFLEFIAYFY